MSGDPDLPLVQALQAGRDEALDLLMERHQEAVFRFIRRSVWNEADARELAQETFVRAYFHIGRFRPRAPFLSWLFRIAANLCRDRARSKAYRQARRTEALPEGREVPARMEEEKPELEALRAAIAALPAGLREPLVLTALEGLSQEEAGRRLGLSARAVENRARRARARLLRRLG
ncbi:MAG: RNA polymerase sigma factor [Verrucomicrobium sp.]|nr:RNA polymerase sigma factor [Verrucomicrobium sp.]